MRVINYAIYGALLGLATLFLGFFLLVKFGVFESPIPHNYTDFIPKAFIVESGSMEPAIKVGSIVLTLKSSTYFPGDIITFKNAPGGKMATTHRIQFKNYPEGVGGAPEYLTAGDANEDIDTSSVRDGQIIGKMVFTVPYAGYLANFAKNPKGFILLVIIPATIIIYEELKFLKSEFGKAFAGLLSKRKKRGLTIQNDSFPKEASKPLPKISIIVPLVGTFIVVISLSMAYLFDLETSLGNILGAATSFGEETASLYNSDPYTCPTGATAIDGTFGTVILKKVGTDLKVDVILNGATPNQTYDIWVNQDPGGCPLSSPTFPGAILTDASGNGTYSGSIPLVSGATNFWVSAVGGGQVLRSTAVSF